jgi:protein-disulfide isomerase
MQERSQAFMAELRQSHKVEYLFEEPKSPKVQIPVTDKNPSKGSPNAKVTIVEFSDFQCPFCARALPTLKEIEKNYGDKVRVVFRHFPLSFHQTARTQAMASACAHDQGKFWDYHDKLFTDQDKLTAAFGGNNEEALRKKLVEFAKDIEMDTAVFSKCLAENKHMDTINDDMRAAEDAGVSSTPSFFVNGQLLAGALPFPEFKKIIDPALGK